MRNEQDTPSISLVIPALNEEERLEMTVGEHHQALRSRFSVFEIIVINDGSSDRTARVAGRCAERFTGVRVLHHDTPWGLGSAFRDGAEAARNDYVTYMPADGAVDPATLDRFYDAAGQVDIVVGYVENLNVRAVHRRLISRLWTSYLNAVTGFRLPYYNGIVLYRRSRLLALPPWTSSFAYQAEILVSLMARGATHVCAPLSIRATSEKHTKAFRPRNIVGVARTGLRIARLMRPAPRSDTPLRAAAS